MFGEDCFPIDPDEELDAVDMDGVEMELEATATPAKPSAEAPMTPNPVVKPVKEATPAPPTPEVTWVEDVRPSLLPPADASFFSISSAGNDDSVRVYLKERTVTAPVVSEMTGQFLEKPLAELHAMAIDQSATRAAEFAQWLTVANANTTTDNRQFVDKYKPLRFIDLLSDDFVNKQMLTWLSEWRKNSMSPSATTTISAPVVAVPHEPGTLPPPAQNMKVMLIGGPPGVGKSALIEVCCRHFKYQLVESNASDDRGRLSMIKTVTDVCGNRSVLDATNPQILVIEEVDGDECAAADVLVDILNKHPETIKRPVICVCTDVYKRSLKYLRDLSTVLILDPPKQMRLAEKLKWICQQESVKIESLAIDRLISLCEGDVHSCLNQLQALASRVGRSATDSVKVADVMKYVGNDGNSRSADAAVKDNQKSEYELMQLLFEPKRSRPANYRDAVNVAIANSKSLPQSVGDVFSHCFVTIPYTDVNLRYTAEVCGLMSLTDTGVMAGGHTLPMRYASHWCAAVGKPRIDIQGARKLIATRYSRQADRAAITAALVKSALHSVRASKIMMTKWGLYVTRLLLLVMSPEHNPVWVKKGTTVHPEIDRIAKIYAEFGIELVSDSGNGSGGELTVTDFTRGGKTTNEYVMNPNLRLLSELDDVAAEQAIPGFAVGSQMGELLRAQVRLHLTKMQSANDSSAELISKGKRTMEFVEDEQSKKARTAISLSTWAARPLAAGTSSTGTGVPVMKKFPFEFRFNEGHTNAVRRVLHLRDFLVTRNG